MISHTERLDTRQAKNSEYVCLYRLIVFVGILCVISQTTGQMTPALAAKEPKKANSSTASPERILALDQTNWTRPQSSFNWVAMARDIQTPWNSFGRQGWLTDDAYVEPVDPGISEFSQNTEMFYIVFQIGALDAPSQFRAAWYFVPDGITPETKHTGTDALFLEMNEKAGYLEIFRPETGWKTGTYLLKLFFESPGQALYNGNIVGTMVFTITDQPLS